MFFYQKNFGNLSDDIIMLIYEYDSTFKDYFSNYVLPNFQKYIDQKNMDEWFYQI
jgi:hypothetical protein